VIYQDHVSSLSAWVLPYPSGYVFPLSRGRMAFASWSLLRPLKTSAPLTGSPTTRVDFIGVIAFHSFKLRPGRAFSLLREPGIRTHHYAV